MSEKQYPIDEKDIGSSTSQDERPQVVKRRPWWQIGGTDISFVPADAGYPAVSNSASSSDTKLGDANERNGRHVWNSEEAKQIYKPIEGYEGAHRFDPTLTWTPEEEARLVRRVRKPVYLSISFTNEPLA
jgi:hypothetical protein